MPYTVAVPAWNAGGLLPPCNVSSPTSSDRSPYRVSLVDIIKTLGTSGPRIDILIGYLNYRQALHSIGVVSGFQWIDGSFTENIEKLESRPPGDIDVISFYTLPPSQTQRSLKLANPILFPSNPSERASLKAAYKVDGFGQELKTTQVDQLIARSVYWYSVWSHRRDATWKGYLEVDLAPSQDVSAQLALQQLPPHLLASVTFSMPQGTI